MPWTLYRYILIELIKIMTMVVVMLVFVISFAAAIKPMSDGLLSAGAVIKFVGYSAPTMLGFALPFAGAFASTLVFIRMATDNEIIACSASGMSYAKVLAPVAALGLVLTMGLFYLSNFVVPGFYKAAAQTLENDLMSVLVTQLDQNRPFTEIPGFVVYADSATQKEAPPETGASRYIRLEGATVGEFDNQQRVRVDSTARIANILLFQDDEGSRVTIMLLDAMRYQPDTGELEYVERLPFGPVPLDTPFKDDPKFLSWPELRELDRKPERYDDVKESKTELGVEYAVAQLRSLIFQQVRADHGREGVRLSGKNQEYLIRSPAARMQSGGIRLLARQNLPITVEYPADAPLRRMEAQSGFIKINPPSYGGLEPSASIELFDLRVFTIPNTEALTEAPEGSLPPLRWPEPVIEPETLNNSIEQLQALASDQAAISPNVSRAQTELSNNIHKLGRKIVSQLHVRAASAVTCLMLLLFGSVLAMHLKGQMPLVVFFWSFMLAIVSIIIIHTGQNLATSRDTSISVGLSVLWMGNIGIALASFVVYRKLARN